MLGRLCLDRCGLTCWIPLRPGGRGRGLAGILGPSEGEQTPAHWPGQLLVVEPELFFTPPLRGRGQFTGTVVGDLTSGLAAGLCSDSTALSTFWSRLDREGTCSGSEALAWGGPSDHATPGTPVCLRAVASLVSTAAWGSPHEGRHLPAASPTGGALGASSMNPQVKPHQKVLPNQ